MSAPSLFLGDGETITDALYRYGRVQRTLTEPFLSGTLPSWLTASSGTPTYNALSAGLGGYSISAAAGSGTKAELDSAITFLPSSFNAIMWTLQGVYFDSGVTAANSLLQFGFYSTSSGVVGLQQSQNAANAELIVVTGSVTSPLSYQFTSDTASAHRDVSILLIPGLKEIYFLEGDQVMAYMYDSGISLTAAMKAIFSLSNYDGSNAHQFSVCQASLTLVHN